jgi:hypothetical protein
MPLYVAVGVAILRYRLYEIDLIINRTLVYSSLTATLALVYFGGVTATQAVLQTATGQERLPQLVIVASTLVIAALFNPLRRYIQSFVDQHFYRKKYDARKTRVPRRPALHSGQWGCEEHHRRRHGLSDHAGRSGMDRGLVHRPLWRRVFGGKKAVTNGGTICTLT